MLEIEDLKSILEILYDCEIMCEQYRYDNEDEVNRLINVVSEHAYPGNKSEVQND